MRKEKGIAKKPRQHLPSRMKPHVDVARGGTALQVPTSWAEKNYAESPNLANTSETKKQGENDVVRW